jgi:hypothetical protein
LDVRRSDRLGQVGDGHCDRNDWPYTATGVGFAILGVFCSAYAFRRHREVEDAVRRGEFAHPDERFIALISVFADALGVVLVIVLAEA